MLSDRLNRPLRNLRLSLTDRCNLRCSYCMPEEEYVWLPREDVLSFEEMARLVEVFADLAVDKVRLTGGEPLLRRDLARLVRMLADTGRLRDLAVTTNGILLGEQAAELRAAGLHRVTVSLDTLDPARFRALTRRDTHARVLEGRRLFRGSASPYIRQCQSARGSSVSGASSSNGGVPPHAAPSNRRLPSRTQRLLRNPDSASAPAIPQRLRQHRMSASRLLAER